MPNISVTVYVTDKEYIAYINKKLKIHEKVREVVKTQLGK